MFTEERQKQLFEKVRKYFKENKPDYLHDIDHIARVVFWTKLLSEKENAKSSITIPAAILHDIGIPKYGDELHASKGAEMCKPMLKECGYAGDDIEKIAETISMHSTHDSSPPKTLEERVLFDADKMDATGPVALHRWFFEFAKHGYLHHEALGKIFQQIEEWREKYGDPPFFTKTGKQLGKDGLIYIENQCKEILRDLEKFKELYKLI